MIIQKDAGCITHEYKVLISVDSGCICSALTDNSPHLFPDDSSAVIGSLYLDASNIDNIEAIKSYFRKLGIEIMKQALHHLFD